MGGPCPAFHFCEAASGYGIPCPAGTYDDSEGNVDANVCLDTARGYYSHTVTGHGNDDVSSSSDAAAMVTDTCAVGYYCPDTSPR